LEFGGCEDSAVEADYAYFYGWAEEEVVELVGEEDLGGLGLLVGIRVFDVVDLPSSSS
jgi:hypothetical protein